MHSGHRIRDDHCEFFRTTYGETFARKKVTIWPPATLPFEVRLIAATCIDFLLAHASGITGIWNGLASSVPSLNHAHVLQLRATNVTEIGSRVVGVSTKKTGVIDR